MLILNDFFLNRAPFKPTCIETCTVRPQRINMHMMPDDEAAQPASCTQNQWICQLRHSCVCFKSRIANNNNNNNNTSRWHDDDTKPITDVTSSLPVISLHDVAVFAIASCDGNNAREWTGRALNQKQSAVKQTQQRRRYTHVSLRGRKQSHVHSARKVWRSLWRLEMTASARASCVRWMEETDAGAGGDDEDDDAHTIDRLHRASHCEPALTHRLYFTGGWRGERLPLCTQLQLNAVMQ